MWSIYNLTTCTYNMKKYLVLTSMGLIICSQYFWSIMKIIMEKKLKSLAWMELVPETVWNFYYFFGNVHYGSIIRADDQASSLILSASSWTPTAILHLYSWHLTSKPCRLELTNCTWYTFFFQNSFIISKMWIRVEMCLLQMN